MKPQVLTITSVGVAAATPPSCPAADEDAVETVGVGLVLGTAERDDGEARGRDGRRRARRAGWPPASP